MHVQAKIKKWGNSLGLRLSGPLKSLPQFTENMIVDIEVSEAGLVITPATNQQTKKLPFSEMQLVSGLSEKIAYADLLAPLLPKEHGDE